MIHKSYLVEENFGILKSNIVLFYGENIGLKQDFKNKVTHKFKKSQILQFDQDSIVKNQNILFDEINNNSLFHESKVIILKDINDKSLNIIRELVPLIDNNKVFLFSNLLEKKSKLRNFLEEKADVVPCYQDNEITIRKLILKYLNDYRGLDAKIISLIIDNCSNDRAKLNNEIFKIKTYFDKKSININDLIQLLNVREDEVFNICRDNAILGKKDKTNKLLNSTIVENEKLAYYLSLINHRLLKLKEISDKNSNIEKFVEEIKPPIFWKDKPVLIQQAKIWNTKKINKALEKTYNVELTIKSNANIDKRLLLKKLIVDICNLANVA